MENAVIVHGKANQAKYYDGAFESPSNAGWLPWIQKQLLLHDILAQTPEMPKPWKPEYVAWCREFERFDITPKTLLIGHSCGAGFLVRWLSEHTDVYVGKVVLVAPWLDPDQTSKTSTFFNFVMDAHLSERTAKLTMFNSNDDFSGAKISARMVKDTIQNINVREFDDYGHFASITVFPELRDELFDD